MQHTALWRSKFRILRIKKTRTKIGTLRISHTSLKLHRDIPSGSFILVDYILSVSLVVENTVDLCWDEGGVGGWR